MTDQYRATPEQWLDVETNHDTAGYSCLRELRARIESLEADQLEQAESYRFCTDAIAQRVEALELARRIQ